MAEGGLSVPTYAYAANNPLRYVDPTGRDVVFLSSNTARVAAANAELASLSLAPGAIGAAAAGLAADPNFRAVFDLDIQPTFDVNGEIVRVEAHTTLLNDGTYTQVSPTEVGTNFRKTVAHELGHAAAARLAGLKRGGMCNALARDGLLRWPSDRWRNRVLPMSFESWSASHNGLDAFGGVKLLHRSIDTVGGSFPWSRW